MSKCGKGEEKLAEHRHCWKILVMRLTASKGILFLLCVFIHLSGRSGSELCPNGYIPGTLRSMIDWYVVNYKLWPNLSYIENLLRWRWFCQEKNDIFHIALCSHLVAVLCGCPDRPLRSATAWNGQSYKPVLSNCIHSIHPTLYLMSFHCHCQLIVIQALLRSRSWPMI